MSLDGFMKKVGLVGGLGAVLAGAPEKAKAEDVINEDNGHKVAMTQAGEQKTVDGKTNASAFYGGENTQDKRKKSLKDSLYYQEDYAEWQKLGKGQDLYGSQKLEILEHKKRLFTEYLMSPEFNKLLAERMYGDEPIDEIKKQNITDKNNEIIKKSEEFSAHCADQSPLKIDMRYEVVSVKPSELNRALAMAIISEVMGQPAESSIFMNKIHSLGLDLNQQDIKFIEADIIAIKARRANSSPGALAYSGAKPGDGNFEDYQEYINYNETLEYKEILSILQLNDDPDKEEKIMSNLLGFNVHSQKTFK